jgi:F-type H+-transporting ATPase subunit a
MFQRHTPIRSIALTVIAAATTWGAVWAQDHGHGHDQHEGHDGHEVVEGHSTEGAEHHEEHASEFKAGDFIVGHIADAHDIHMWGHTHIPLPVILWTDRGLDVVMSSNFKEEGDGHHGHADRFYYSEENDVHYTLHASEKHEGDTTILAGSITADEVDVLDLSITKSVFGMLLIMAFMVWMFGSVARGYKKRGTTAPTGLANALEPLILFIRDEVAKPAIGKHANQYLPFLLTVFFFTFFSNLLGLVPFLGGFNITGTLGITLVMATLVFLITNLTGNKHYWGHVLWMPGVPWPVKALILTPIEVIGLILKPTVLMIRLTANITAGHIIILAFTSLIFIFGKGGEDAVAGMGIGVFSTAFMIFMYMLELLVAFLQAFVFTLLAALYFGDAKQEAHH